jgi:hypothetical protein
LKVVALCIVIVTVFIGLTLLWYPYLTTRTTEQTNTVTISLNPPTICRNNILLQKNNKADADKTTNGKDTFVQPQCWLHHYRTEDVVTCLDELSFRRAQHKEPIQIAFVGDSIIRNQFKSLLRV